MITTRLFLFLLCILTVIPIGLKPQEEIQVSRCNIQVNVDPASGQIVCKAEFINPQDTAFILNKDMQIHWIAVDGKPVAYKKMSTDIVSNAYEIIVPARKSVKFVYSGKIIAASYPPEINVANMVSPKLVEIARYVGWYPRPKNSLFGFELEADLPADFITITNGFLLDEKIENNRRKTKWHSDGPVSDIVLLTAPGLKKSVHEEKDLTIEFYFDKLPEDYIKKMQNQLSQAMKELENFFGPARADKFVRVAYSPRQGWGYVRPPFIIVSEGRTLDWQWQKFGPERDFRYLTHEIAHYWWSIADVNTPDDWINEGLAEYSAFIVSKTMIGEEFTNQLLKEYKQRVESTETETAIALTENNSPDREVNRYDKAVLMFNEAAQKFGKENLHLFLKTLYERFAGTGNLTTALFLQYARSRMGTEAENFFETALYDPDWKGE